MLCVWYCAAEPDFLFRARQLSDLEDGLSPSTRVLLTAALPALPVLLLGLVSLEAKDLVGRDIDVQGREYSEVEGGGAGGPRDVLKRLQSVCWVV